MLECICGHHNDDNAKVCYFCKRELKLAENCMRVSSHTRNSESNCSEPISLNNYTEPGEDPVYIEAFAKLNKDMRAWVWSWAGFFWGVFWYFYKGMWLKGLIMAIAILFTGGLLGPWVWIWAGINGKRDYYRLKVLKTQL